MALSDSLPQIHLGVQGETQGGLHSGAQRINPEFRIGSNFRIIPEQNRQENWRETRGNNRYSDNSRPWREFNRFEGQGVADSRRFDGRRRGGQSDHRFHNQGGRQGDQPGLTHVLYHEIDTGKQGLVVSRPYRYDRVKQGKINYHIEKMLQEGVIRPIQSPYASSVVSTRRNNGLTPDSPTAYRFTIDYRKLNAITKYPRYPLPDAFNKVKRALTEAPVLQLPNFKEQFNLFTDASGVGIGAVLNQNHRLIAFASRTLNKVERNYTVTERECLVVIWALNKFKTYFGSLPVKVITDHTALTKLTNGKNLSSRMIRWALKLSEFNIEWEHRPGVQNVVADVLSWNPVGNMDGSQIACAALRALALNSREQLIREQREDPELGHISIVI
ncbi:retrovirus-related Pol polyprotein from transposon opus [Trichonephila clavipes]|nr:retrovirus-related Pol polyprotein from transposon opus [Trichonephila clavipes]